MTAETKDLAGTISARLREARGAVSQARLARRAGLNPSTPSHYETGVNTPQLENLIKLADALDVSLDWLCGRGERKKRR